MLKNTLVLPESDVRLAVKILRDAVESLDIVLMLVIGKEPEVTGIVEWADKLCIKTATADGNLRMVVWIRDVSTQTMREELTGLIGGGPLPRIAVLNFHDQFKAKIDVGEEITPLKLEMAFVKGHGQ